MTDKHMPPTSFVDYILIESEATFANLFRRFFNDASTIDTNTYVIDFHILFKEVGFARKDAAKRVLVTHLTENVEYILRKTKRGHQHGGSNKELIYVNIVGASKFAALAGTPQRFEIQSFFIDLCNKLTIFNDLKQKAESLEAQRLQTHESLCKLYSNKRIVYLGYINNKSVKYGSTDNILRRSSEHKRTYGSFILYHIEEHDDFRQLEKLFERHSTVAQYRTTFEDHLGKEHREIIALNG
jgi:hypothetical protein